ncbi:MAG TPA: Gfo/Idh/MocA family oxidoreductase, partial [Armatimonadota bacterium]|nr:Gfo/Idh/MocA family oxidoreductase [Armatimonadota bacterium]
MNRRDFLARSGRAAAGVAAGLTILKGRAVAQNDTIGVAVAGIHGRGVSHIEAFSRMEGVRVVALCDPDSSLFADRAAIAEKAQGSRPRTYQDIREALDDPEVDAVSIATCNHWHALMTVWACQAGKDVYCEKPVSWSVWEGRKAVEAARKYQRIVAGGHQSRSEKKKRDAIARLWAGQLGGPCYLSRALCFKPRGSIGFKEPKDPPD